MIKGEGIAMPLCKFFMFFFLSFFTKLCSLNGQVTLQTQDNLEKNIEKKLILKEKKQDISKLFLNPFIGEKEYFVRRDNGLSFHELNFLVKRLPIVMQNIADFVPSDQLSLSTTPIISSIGSGGGYRAMIGYLGFLKGLESLNFLDTIAYNIGLSGSTWTIASLMAHSQSPSELQEYLQKQIEQSFDISLINRKEVVANLKEKLYYRQKITFCDLWGSIISHFIFCGRPHCGQRERLENFAPLVETGRYPYPIFTGILDNLEHYEWMEFGPHEIGSEFLNTWIPSNCFGKKFKNGVSNDTRPGASLSYLVGLFGSAYSLNLDEHVKYLHSLVIEQFDQRVYTPFEFFENFRFSPPMVRNMTRGLEGFPLCNNRYQVVLDAGLAFNLPFPPAVRRKSNIILCCDMSENVQNGEAVNELKKVEAYMKRKGIPFPEINYENIEKQEVNIFYDEQNLESPIILYFPHHVEFATMKFEYNKEEFEKVCNTMQQQVIDSREMILYAIQLAHQRLVQLMGKQNTTK